MLSQTEGSLYVIFDVETENQKNLIYSNPDIFMNDLRAVAQSPYELIQQLSGPLIATQYRPSLSKALDAGSKANQREQFRTILTHFPESHYETLK